MSTKTIAYEQKLPEITAIAREDVKKPSMPMDVYLQEANNVYHWAKADLAELQKAGFSADLLEDLPVRCDAASEAQSLWHNVMRSQEQAQQQWSQESPEAYALRDEILHTMRYAFRDNESKLTKARSVAEGNRECGQFVFWKNETRRRGYISDYIKKMNSSSTVKPAEPVEENSIAS